MHSKTKTVYGRIQNKTHKTETGRFFKVDEIIRWLTGYTQKGLESHLQKQTNFETFFAKAPKPNPSRKLISGIICGVKVQEIKDPLMREIRYLDKLIDELAKGKSMEKILRKEKI